METLIIVGVIVSILGLLFLYNYYRDKGVISGDFLHLTEDLLLFAKIILSKNTNNPVRVEKVFDIVRHTLNFIQEQEDVNTDDKKEMAINQIIESLEAIDIDVDLEIELLIDIVVSNYFSIVKQ